MASGIANENTRKLMSGGDYGAGSGNAQKVSDNLMVDTYKNDIEIPLDTVLKNLGSFPLFSVKFRVKYVVTFPPPNKIMAVQSGQSVAG